MIRTVRAGDLAPDDADLGATDRSLSAVDVRNALTGVPLCGLGAVDTLELEEGGAGVGVALAPLVGDVLAPACEVSRCPRCPTYAFNRTCPAHALCPVTAALPKPKTLIPLMETNPSSCSCSPRLRDLRIRHLDTEQSGSTTGGKATVDLLHVDCCNGMLAHVLGVRRSQSIAPDPVDGPGVDGQCDRPWSRLTAVGLFRHRESFLASGICGRWVSGPKSLFLPVSSDRSSPRSRERFPESAHSLKRLAHVPPDQ